MNTATERECQNMIYLINTLIVSRRRIKNEDEFGFQANLPYLTINKEIALSRESPKAMFWPNILRAKKNINKQLPSQPSRPKPYQRGHKNYKNQIDNKNKNWAQSGIEPETCRTRSGHHTPRPLSHDYHLHPQTCI